MSTISIERPSEPLAEVADGQLVREHLAGRDEAFEVLYERHHARLVGWFIRRTGDRVLAEDLAQDTMVRLLKYEDSFNQDRPMWPWLKTTAYRVMVNHLDETPDGDESFEDQYEDEGEPDPLLSSIEERPALERVLRLLSKRHQTALSLRYVRGWSPDEVADFFGVNRNACNQLMHRARHAARREYDRVCGEVRALVWPLLLPFAARWRSVLNRFRESRWTSNSLQLANVLPSVENALQAAVATAVAMFVVATAGSAVQVPGPTDAGGEGVVAPASLERTNALGEAAHLDNGVPSAEKSLNGGVAPAEVPENSGSTRQIIAVASDETTSETESKTGMAIAAQTARSQEGEGDGGTLSGRVRAKLGHDGEEGDVVGFQLYCDTGDTTQTLCDAVDELP